MLHYCPSETLELYTFTPYLALLGRGFSVLFLTRVIFFPLRFIFVSVAFHHDNRYCYSALLRCCRCTVVLVQIRFIHRVLAHLSLRKKRGGRRKGLTRVPKNNA